MNPLQFAQAYDRCTTDGWLSLCQAALLITAAESTTGSLVEVGSYKGRSAMLLAQLGRTLHCIDTWEDYEGQSGDEVFEQFWQNIRSLMRTTPDLDVVVYRQRVEDWEPIEAGFVYLDGDHTYEGTMRQIQIARECKPQIVAAHDLWLHPVEKATNKIWGPPHQQVESLGIWRLR